jgi:hypothetical protein
MEGKHPLLLPLQKNLLEHLQKVADEQIGPCADLLQLTETRAGQ